MSHINRRYLVLSLLTINKDYDISKIVPNSNSNNGWFRLKLLFEKDELGDNKPEFNIGMYNTVGGFFILSFIGGVSKARQQWMSFVDSNLLTKYINNTPAKRNLHRSISATFFKNAIKWGFLGALYTGAFTYTVIIVSLYRGKSSIVDYACAGLVTGIVTKVHYGLRGIILGGLTGLFIGSFFGSLHLIAIKLTGQAMEKTIEMNYTVENINTKVKKKNVQKYMEMEKTDILKDISSTK